MAEPPEITALRDASTELRRLSLRVGEITAEVVAHDRPDVWRGGVARSVSEDLDCARARLTHPVVGATALLDAAALRLLAKADALAASGCLTCPP